MKNCGNTLSHRRKLKPTDHQIWIALKNAYYYYYHTILIAIILFMYIPI